MGARALMQHKINFCLTAKKLAIFPGHSAKGDSCYHSISIFYHNSSISIMNIFNYFNKIFEQLCVLWSQKHIESTEFTS